MIVILDYDMGNVCSIQNMLKHINVDSMITNDLAKIAKADKLILPGVGSYDMGIESLALSGLMDCIREHDAKNKPILGICLGMQLLGRRSEEGQRKGLGLIDFDNVKFSFDTDSTLKIPHMGWDVVEATSNKSSLVNDLADNQRYYFVHSYHAKCDRNENEILMCDYGYRFAAAVQKENVYGVQFHPEKSLKFGMALLQNFARKC